MAVAKRVGILGSGDVGRVLGAGFGSIGYLVKMGTREPGSKKVKEWVAANGPYASAGTFAEAAAFGDLVVLATLWSGTETALKLAGAERLAGKIVIDATNPLAFKEHEAPTLALGYTDSAGEQVQRWLPKSKVVKAFNMAGHAQMVHPKLIGGPPDMFFCGNDEGAKRTVAEILHAFGWNTVDIGGIDGARLLEPLSILRIKYGLLSGSWKHAFKMIRR
jgi:predicted dinucleotide-binding enzyme